MHLQLIRIVQTFYQKLIIVKRMDSNNIRNSQLFLSIKELHQLILNMSVQYYLTWKFCNITIQRNLKSNILEQKTIFLEDRKAHFIQTKLDIVPACYNLQQFGKADWTQMSSIISYTIHIHVIQKRGKHLT